MKESKITSIGIVAHGWGGMSLVKGLLLDKRHYYLELVSKDEKILEYTCDADCQLKSSIDEIGSDIVICSGIKNIIQKHLLDKKKVFNIHYSLLPMYRGLHSTAWAIMNDEKWLGLTVHLMNEFIDDGPILYQWRVKNDLKSSLTYYMNLFNQHIEYNIGDILMGYASGKVNLVPQNKSLATWVPRRTHEHNLLDFSFPFCKIRNVLRILNPPYPYPHVLYEGKCFYVRDVALKKRTVMSDIGRIVNIDEEGVWVQGTNGYVVLKDLFIDAECNEKLDTGELRIGKWMNIQN